MTRVCPLTLNVLACLSISAAAANLRAQPDSLPPFITSSLENSGFSENDLPETDITIEDLNNPKIDLNADDVSGLLAFPLITPTHLKSLYLHRSNYGDLLSVYELQAVPGFSVEVINSIRQFVTIRAKPNLPWHKSESISRAKQTLTVRWSAELETARGFSSGNSARPFTGDRSSISLAYRYVSPRLTFGFVADKDRGEKMFGPGSRFGFDAYGFHLVALDPLPWMPKLLIGRFRISLGQGLISPTAFLAGKAASVGGMKNSFKGLRQVASHTEGIFNHGIASEVRIASHITLITGISIRKRDANIIEIESPGSSETQVMYTSLQTTGLHRTAAEIADKNAVTHQTIIGSLQYRRNAFTIALNTLSHHFSKNRHQQSGLHNQFQFTGRRLTNASCDFTAILENFHLFGEVAWSLSGKIAVVGGLLTALGPKSQMSLVIRKVPASFQAIESNPPIENSTGNNENGMLLTMTFTPSPSVTLMSYADLWRTPFVRAGSDILSYGNELFLRGTFRKRHQMLFYAQIKIRKLLGTRQTEPGKTKTPDLWQRINARLHLQFNPIRNLEFRSRLEYVRYSFSSINKSAGFLIFQDIIYRPVGSPFVASARIALFDTNDYDTRIYAYESDMTGGFHIPPYAHKGMRVYLNMRYRINKKLVVEARIANWQYVNRQAVGSGYNQIPGPSKTDLSLRLKYTFSD